MVFFVRRETAPDKPFVTMSVDMGRLSVLQCYGTNDKPPGKDVRSFVRKFLAHLKKAEREDANNEAEDTRAENRCA